MKKKEQMDLDCTLYQKLKFVMFTRNEIKKKKTRKIWYKIHKKNNKKNGKKKKRKKITKKRII